MKQEFVSKLGTSKNVKRSRIWLQGKRLTAAGFIPGVAYTALWHEAKLVLTTDAVRITTAKTTETRKISGKGDLPIIDIVGQRVLETFGMFVEHVNVKFEQGVITITPSK